MSLRVLLPPAIQDQASIGRGETEPLLLEPLEGRPGDFGLALVEEVRRGAEPYPWLLGGCARSGSRSSTSCPCCSQCAAIFSAAAISLFAATESPLCTA